MSYANINFLLVFFHKKDILLRGKTSAFIGFRKSFFSVSYILT